MTGTLLISGLSATLGEFRLQPLDLTLAASSTSVLIGPSGCGKSTLLKLIMGLSAPDSGKILLDGAELTRLERGERAATIGYVSQSGGLFPHLNAANNVALPGTIAGMEPLRIKKRVQQLAELVRLDPMLLAQHPQHLSGGERQRVALMRALFLDPPLLLLDEPLGALDPLVRFAIQDELKRLFAQLGKTVLMVSHDLAEATHLGAQLVLLNQGQLVQAGPPSAFKRSPTTDFVSSFIGATRVPFEG